MRVFRVFNDDEKWGLPYDFNVHHQWGIPGVKCTTCGSTWGIVGLDYPALTLPPGADPSPYEDRWPVRLDKLQELMRPLRRLLDPALPLLPGTGFGPLHGTASGKHGDFTWAQNWLPLISKSALDSLRRVGITTLLALPVEVSVRGRRPFPYLELQIEARASLAPSASEPNCFVPCPACGRIKLAGVRSTEPNRYKLLRSSLPASLDLFRSREMPTFIFATQRFADAVSELRLTNIAFSEVDVVEYSVQRHGFRG